MELNKLYEALEKKAISSERSKIQDAIHNFTAALRHPNGSSFQFDKIKLNAKINKDEVEVEVDTSVFFSALKKHLLSARREVLIGNQIHQFMKSQEQYANQINSMQEYLDEH